MAIDNAGSIAFLATGTDTYPLAGSIDGTTTAGSSATLASESIVLESAVVEDFGSGNGTLTITNHAGTKSIAVPILTAAPQDKHWGPFGMELKGWRGIKAIVSGTGMKVRILIRYG